MAYTLTDLTSAVQDDLKDPSFSTTRIHRYLNYGQDAIFNKHMFRFCEKIVSGTLTVSSYAYDQQSDHQATIGGVLIDPVDTAKFFVLNDASYMPHRQFFELYPNPATNTAGMPSNWTEYGNEILFNCPADKAYTFKQRYFRKATDMTLDADVPDVPQSFRELLELYADYRSEKYRGNHDIAATYKQDFDDGLEDMVLRYAEGQQNGPVQMPSARTWISE